jgi:TonB family protein
MNNKTLAFLFLFFIFGLSGAAFAQNKPSPAPKSINGGVVNGKAKTLVKPTYPAAARATAASGEVKVQVTIDEQGDVVSATAVSGHPLLRAAAVEAARASKFSPTLLSGQPVKVSGVIVYNFVPDTPPEFNEPYWALSFLISLVQNAEPELIDQLDKDKGSAEEESFDDILRDLSKDVPEEFAAQRPLFTKLAATRGEERRQAARELNISFKNQLRGLELWQYEIGEQLSIVLVETMKYSLENRNENFRMDEAALRAGLQNIKKHLAAAPAETSPEFSEKIKKIAAFADVPDLLAGEKMTELFESLEPLFAVLENENK